MLAHLAAYVGPCWPTLGHKSRKMGAAKNTVKCGSFWWYVVVGGRGGGPLSPSERRELPYGKDGQLRAPRAPGRISAYARQPGRGSTILPPSCGYVGLCWPTLAYLAGNVGPAWGYVGPAWGYVGLSWRLCGPILRPMLAHCDPCWAKRSEKWEQQKNTRLVAMLASVGPSWSYVGLNVGPSWGYVGPSWTHLRARLAHLGAMLAHLAAYVGPCYPS